MSWNTVSDIMEVFQFQKKCKYLPTYCLLLLCQKKTKPKQNKKTTFRVLAFRCSHLEGKWCWQGKSSWGFLQIWISLRGGERRVWTGAQRFCETMTQRGSEKFPHNCPLLDNCLHLCPVVRLQLRPQFPPLAPGDDRCVRDSLPDRVTQETEGLLERLL